MYVGVQWGKLQIEVVVYLLTVDGIDVNMVDQRGGTPLDDAYRHSHKVIITLLQDNRAVRGNHKQLEAKVCLGPTHPKLAQSFIPHLKLSVDT
jgi:hypothetical protein